VIGGEDGDQDDDGDDDCDELLDHDFSWRLAGAG